MDDDTTLIGEGVVLETAPASIGLRTAGAIIDAFAIGLVYVGSFLALAEILPESLDLAAMSAAVLVHALAVFIGIPIAVETATRGRSLGKWATGVRIVRDDGGPIAFRQAFVRGLMGFFDLWMTAGGLALISALVTKRAKRVGDVLAGTYALKERAAKSPHAPLVMPVALASWAATADVRRMPDGLALTARQFLSRAPRLNPASRAQHGADLGARVAAYVSPHPPEGTHPEQLIAAALVIRRDREYARGVEHQRLDSEIADAVHRLPHGVPEVL
ncbi:RDD family protein [Demequina salsinemoris]|uniref:RDD family protein n=1 Tax=Demequina salsinemoris TaxID=577470 RepID=UPI000783CAE1|nr:RDD family protein [Demequina salsinemoris]